METIKFGEPNNRKPPLLFIHGSYCGAWIWQRYFLPYFAREGFYGAAISLRGHGRDEDKSTLDCFGLYDFLSDIAQGVHLFDVPPVLIGHSMGGYLVQRYALEHEVRGMVLLGSPALTGLAGSSQHILANNPTLAIQLGLLMAFGPSFADIDVINQALCDCPLSPDARAELAGLLQAESKRVTSEIMWPYWVEPEHKPPTLVLGGDKDAFVPVSDFKYAAASWDATLKIMPGVPHGGMLAKCWSSIAKEIQEWLEATFPPRKGG
ncbi:MAG: alpha/beta hydrolase [Bdellovibrionales bacterium]